MTTTSAELRDATDRAARSLARRVSAGEVLETDARIQISVDLIRTGLVEQAVDSALATLRVRPTDTMRSDLVGEARGLLFDLCTDTARSSSLDLERLGSDDLVSACGWAAKLIKASTRFTYDRLQKASRRTCPESGPGLLRSQSDGFQGRGGYGLSGASMLEVMVAYGHAKPVHPTMTCAPIDDNTERLLDAAEVQQQLMENRVSGGPMWIETSTRSIIAGFGIGALPRRLAGTDRVQLLELLDGDPRWAQSQICALVAEADREPVRRPIHQLTRTIVGHLPVEGLRDLAEHQLACDMVCRYAATPLPVVAKKTAAVFRADIASRLHGRVTPHMISRLCNQFMEVRAEMTCSDRSRIGSTEKSDEQRSADAAAFEKTCAMFVRKTDLFGTTRSEVAATLEAILNHHLSCRTIAA